MSRESDTSIGSVIAKLSFLQSSVAKFPKQTKTKNDIQKVHTFLHGLEQQTSELIRIVEELIQKKTHTDEQTSSSQLNSRKGNLALPSHVNMEFNEKVGPAADRTNKGATANGRKNSSNNAAMQREVGAVKNKANAMKKHKTNNDVPTPGTSSRPSSARQSVSTNAYPSSSAGRQPQPKPHRNQPFGIPKDHVGTTHEPYRSIIPVKQHTKAGKKNGNAENINSTKEEKEKDDIDTRHQAVVHSNTRNDQFEQRETQLYDMRRTIQALENDKTALNKLIKERDDTVDELKKQRDDLNLRFSKLASNNLTKNNADIADLGDQFRAEKIAEVYSHLYDNAWTDAYIALRKDKKRKEEEIVQHLLTILRMPSIRQSQPTEDQLYELKRLRKEFAIDKVDGLKERFYDETKTVHGEDIAKKCHGYCFKCVEVCWPMVLHQPPLHLDDTVAAGSRFDSSRFTQRSSGKTVASLVWPPLVLGDDKRLLKKGVVEGK